MKLFLLTTASVAEWQLPPRHARTLTGLRALTPSIGPRAGVSARLTLVATRRKMSDPTATQVCAR